MTKDEERYWIPLAATGNPEAIAFVLEENGGFAVIIAKSYLGDEGWCDLGDLVQQAKLGQLEAIGTWNPEGGAGFCFWSLRYIQGSIREFLRFRGAVCGSAAMQAVWERAQKASEEHSQATGELLSLADSLRAAGVAEGTIERMERTRVQVLSLEAPYYSDGNAREGARVYDRIPDEGAVDPIENLHREQMLQELSRLLLSLRPRELAILKKRYGLAGEDPMHCKDIAAEISRDTGRSFSKQRVNQIEHSVLDRLHRLACQNPILREAMYLYCGGDTDGSLDRDPPADACHRETGVCRSASDAVPCG